MGCLCFLFFSPLIQFEQDRLREEWDAHKIKKSNYYLVSGIPDNFYVVPESQGYEQCQKSLVMAEVNEVVKKSNGHLDLQGS